jgi:hypothetical protein
MLRQAAAIVISTFVDLTVTRLQIEPQIAFSRAIQHRETSQICQITHSSNNPNE